MEDELTGDRERRRFVCTRWVARFNNPSRTAVRVHTDGGNADILPLKPRNVEGRVSCSNYPNKARQPTFSCFSWVSLLGTERSCYTHSQDKESSKATNIASGRNMFPVTAILAWVLIFKERGSEMETIPNGLFTYPSGLLSNTPMEGTRRGLDVMVSRRPSHAKTPQYRGVHMKVNTTLHR